MDKYSFLPVEHRWNMQPADTDSITTFRHLKPFMCVKSNPTAGGCAIYPLKCMWEEARDVGEESRNPGWVTQPTAPCGPVPFLHFMCCNAVFWEVTTEKCNSSKFMPLTLSLFLIHSISKSTATERRSLGLRLMAEHRTCAPNHWQGDRFSSRFQMLVLRAISLFSFQARTGVHHIQCLAEGGPSSVTDLKKINTKKQNFTLEIHYPLPCHFMPL